MPPNPKRVGHLLFGPDGHRRWAYLNKKSLEDSYRATSKTSTNVIEWSLSESGYVDELTLGLVLERNLERKSEEADVLIDAAVTWVEDVSYSEIVKDLDARVDVVGELDSLSKNYMDSLERILSAVDKVRGHEGKKIHILVAYNDSKELKRALQKCMQKGLEISFGNLSDNWSMPKIDLFMRTGQPRNFNNFSVYLPGIEKARLVGTPKYPQELTKKEFDKMIHSYLNLKDSYKRMINSSTY